MKPRRKAPSYCDIRIVLEDDRYSIYILHILNHKLQGTSNSKSNIILGLNKKFLRKFIFCHIRKKASTKLVFL